MCRRLRRWAPALAFAPTTYYSLDGEFLFDAMPALPLVLDAPHYPFRGEVRTQPLASDVHFSLCCSAAHTAAPLLSAAGLRQVQLERGAPLPRALPRPLLVLPGRGLRDRDDSQRGGRDQGDLRALCAAGAAG